MGTYLGYVTSNLPSSRRCRSMRATSCRTPVSSMTSTGEELAAFTSSWCTGTKSVQAWCTDAWQSAPTVAGTPKRVSNLDTFTQESPRL